MLKMKILELFQGTGSVGKVATQFGYEVISLDIEKKFEPTLCMSILDFDQTQYAPDEFSFVHSSPPCTELSIALTTRPRDYELADAICKKTLEILTYFASSGTPCVMENPYTGKLKTREYMQEFNHLMKVVTYCSYESPDHPYKKKTSLWCWNLPNFFPRRLCKNDCQFCENGRHKNVAQRGGCLRNGTRDKNHFSQAQLYSIPPMLIHEIVESIADSTRKPVANYDKIFAILEELKWPTQKSGRRLQKDTKAFTLGVTLNVPGSKNFELLPSGKAANKRIVPSTVNQQLGMDLWNLLKEEAAKLNFEFSSAQINLNFPGKAHKDRNNCNFQWCCSLGEFSGGQLCWQESDRTYERNTNSVWQKWTDDICIG